MQDDDGCQADAEQRLATIEKRLTEVEQALLRVDAALDGLLLPPPVQAVPPPQPNGLSLVPLLILAA